MKIQNFFMRWQMHWRKNRNFISSLQVDGALLEKLRDLGKAFAAHFNKIFGSKRSTGIHVDLRRLFAFKPPVDLSHLESSFTIDE